jgi:hypothetical protein
MFRILLKTFAVILVIIFTCMNCTHTTETVNEPADVFEVHLQAYYDDTPAKIVLDGNTILDERITTSEIVAFTKILRPEVNQGLHRLQAFINETATADTTITVSDTLRVVVNYVPQRNEITIWATKRPFPYR